MNKLNSVLSKLKSSYAEPYVSGIDRVSTAETVAAFKKTKEHLEQVQDPKLSKEQFDARFNDAFFASSYLATHWRTEIWNFIKPFLK